MQIDDAVTRAFLAALEPAKIRATLAAAEQVEMDRESALKHWRLGVERANYAVSLAERRYRAVDPDNRLVARGLEREWEESLTSLEAAKAELARREQERPRVLSIEERCSLVRARPRPRRRLGRDHNHATRQEGAVGHLIEEVIVKVERDKSAAHLTLRWKGGALTEIDLSLPRSRPATVRTDEDTVALVRRLAVHYPDTVIAGILNRQGRRTARGYRFEGNRVCSLRTHWKIPCFVPKTDAAAGELLTIKRVATVLGVAPSTIHRLINDGIIAGEQITPGAPWRIRLTDDLKARFNGDAGEGLPANARGDPRSWRLTSDRVAACQARRA